MSQAPIYPGQRNDDPTDTYAGSWTYGYDHLNRIANAAGPGGSTAYTIDAFGNKTVQTTKSGSAPSPNYSAALSNGLTGNGVTSDLANYAGNVTYDGFHSYMYDAEGRLYEVVDQTICYTYDGDGDRVATTNCNVVNGGSGNTTGIISEFLYDIDHRLVSQVNPTTAKLTRANIYAGGEFLAEDAPDAAETGTPVATQMRVTDQVGSLRSRWDYAGKQNGGCTSFPYGDGFSCTNAPVSTAEFTGKDRDNESALDYFGARYYSNRMGRFTNPDWSSSEMPVPYASFADPQSLNLYAYTYNNPLSRTDPNGHDSLLSIVIFNVSTYLVTHPDVAAAIEKLGSSIGVKASLGVGGNLSAGPVKAELSVGGYISSSSTGALGGGGQASGGLRVGSTGVEASGTAPFVKVGNLVNPLSNLSGSTSGTISGEKASASGSATAEETSFGATYGEGVSGSLEVTGGTEEIKGVFAAFGNAVASDITDLVGDLKESMTCSTSSCALPPQTRPNPHDE